MEQDCSNLTMRGNMELTRCLVLGMQSKILGEGFLPVKLNTKSKSKSNCVAKSN